jgi:hypothetical protein
MKAEETTASTSLLKDCLPGSSIEEVHVLVVDMQAYMSASFHLGTRIELRHNTPTRHCQVHQQLVAQVLDFVDSPIERRYPNRDGYSKGYGRVNEG